MTSPRDATPERNVQRSRVGALIRHARKAHVPEITQEELAFRTGFPQSRISKIELGKTQRPAKEDLRVIAEALEIDPNELYIAADYAPEPGHLDFDPWLKSIGELSPEDFERLKAAVREREEHERRQRRGNDRR